MDYIKPTSDRKIRFYTAQQNTFGLLPGDPAGGGTCPDCTQAAGGCWYLAPGRKTHTCYVDALMGCYKGIRAVLEHNSRILRAADKDEKVRLLDAEFTRFEEAENKRAKRTGEGPFMHYRIHWSGDVFDREYAEALATAVAKHPKTQFWIYTRSFDFIPLLKQAPNLLIYMSLDQVNYDHGASVYRCWHEDNPNVQFCYMAKENNLALRECPVDAGRMAMEGGCSRCKHCLRPKAGSTGGVWFKT